jgi:hypothetical protein
MRFANRRSRQWGGEVVEFAISLPVILLLFFGIVEMAVGFFDQAILTNASRAAAREAIRAMPPAGTSLADWSPAGEAEEAASNAAQRMFTWHGPETLTFDVDPDDPLTVDDGADVTVTLTYLTDSGCAELHGRARGSELDRGDCDAVAAPTAIA